ncbi:hypothetical protein H2509_14625 [Stappia sp. F7233]|uniref:Uncharacterized protein n=1 Tax=Stappia albiluteola TaxID=2758565 RepID=A0A839AFE9_9HYPH|nr:hypothetical protein [Stappia albiluteola]MBA5778361.1 hypothetical protein [Stappia albiluteola]
MPLQNRVAPDGSIHARPERGAFMGNRGGRLHDPETKLLGTRAFASRQWICCRLSFKGRQREVMGPGYTELFFLDEVTALAAGHRPCFECRREDAKAFVGAWAAAGGHDAPPSAPQMDRCLHAERLDGKVKRLHRLEISTLPDGAMILRDGHIFAIKGETLLPWSFEGYGQPVPRPVSGIADVLTPPTILAVLAAGYRPAWHESARNV